jgi:DNA-binding MarR family transcriptional regulator
MNDAARIALAWRELRRGAAGQVLRSHLLGPDGPRLEQAQLDALEIIASEPDGMPMSDFADALRVEPSSATRAVDRLERLGLAERIRRDGDKRIVLTRVTDDGARTVARVEEIRATGMRRLLETFDDDEQAQLASLLERFVESIDRVVEELEAETTGRG